MGRGAEIVAQIERESLEESRKKAQDTGDIGFVRGLAQGALVKGPQQIQDIANIITPWISPNMIATGMAPRGWPSEAPTDEPTGIAALGAGALSAAGYPYRTPPDATGRLAESLTGGVVSSLPFAVIPGAGLATAAASGASGGFASQSAEELGFGPFWQGVAGVAGGFAPSIAKGAISVVDDFASGVLKKGLYKYGDKVMPNLVDNAARERAGQFLSGAVGSKIDEAVSSIDDELRTALPGRATTSQTLAQTSPGVLDAEGAMIKKGSGSLQSRLASVRTANEEALDDAGRAAFRGDPNQVIGGFEHARDSSKAGVDAAYGAFTDQGTRVSTATLKQAVQDMRQEAGQAGSRHLPKFAVANIEESGDDIGSLGLKQLREAINDDISIAETGSREARHLKRLKAAVDTTLDDVAEAGGGEDVSALRTAIASRATHGRIFGREHPSVKALEKFDDPIIVMDKIVHAPRPVEEARRVQSAISGDAKASDGLKRAFWQRALGGKTISDDILLSDASTKNGLHFIRQNRRVASQILGDEGVETAERLLARAAKIRYGKGGTPGFSQSPGSAFPAFDELMGASTGAARSSRGAMSMAGQYVLDKFEMVVGNKVSEAATQLLEDAFVDPKVARDLLLHVRAKNMAQWSHRMDSHIKKVLTDMAQFSAPRAAAGGVASGVFSEAPAQ